mmetsp:Transcript_70221/g.205915  ORF Transcript_70221/g.205915 Transcript_70221/m.205915 type:complete len:235 (-) Transcript_70221:196-900(-)
MRLQKRFAVWQTSPLVNFESQIGGLSWYPWASWKSGPLRQAKTHRRTSARAWPCAASGIFVMLAATPTPPFQTTLSSTLCVGSGPRSFPIILVLGVIVYPGRNRKRPTKCRMSFAHTDWADGEPGEALAAPATSSAEPLGAATEDSAVGASSWPGSARRPPGLHRMSWITSSSGSSCRNGAMRVSNRTTVFAVVASAAGRLPSSAASQTVDMATVILLSKTWRFFGLFCRSCRT